MHSLFVGYISAIITLSGLLMVSLVSPGPDFAIVVRNILIYSRKTALLTALGIALGAVMHVSYILLGLGLIIVKNPWLLLSIKCLGAGYLIYIGLKGLKAKKAALVINGTPHSRTMSSFTAIWSGFLTNALNPKCILFFISLFSVVIEPQAPFFIMLLYGVIVFLETLAWFSLVAFCLSGKKIREKFTAIGHWIERVTGGILVGLGARLLFMV